MAKASKAYENPLIPHARMRALYCGLVETRALARRLHGPPRGLEATWVAPAIGLEDGDYTSVPRGDALLAWITALATRDAAPTPASLRKLAASASAPFAAPTYERVLCAIGASLALAETKAVAVAWLSQSDLTTAQWTRVLTLAASAPILLLAQPGERKSPDLTSLGRKTGVPVIPVEAADAVALYRVAQESLVRARADRQGAVIDCIRTTTDPIHALAGQLLTKQICTQRWIENVAATTARLIPATPKTRFR